MADLSVTSLQRLKADIYRKRDAAIAAANADADRALNALKIVEAMLNDGAGGGRDVEIQHSAGLFPVNGNGNGSGNAPGTRKVYPTAKWITQIVNDNTERSLSQRTIYAELVRRYPQVTQRPEKSVRAQVAAVLGKLAQKGTLIISKEAHGQEPTEYRRRTVSQEVPVDAVLPVGQDVEWD